VKREIKNSFSQQETSHKKYVQQNDKLNRVADSLKHKNSQLILQLNTARLLLKNQQKIVTGDIPCDSLRKEVLVLNQITNSSDSLCARGMAGLDSMVHVRETQIKICNDEYKSLYAVQKENLERQLRLTEELEVAYKANRKKKFENKMLGLGLMIMSGITTTLFIKSQQ
jgi:hypothetical protein